MQAITSDGVLSSVKMMRRVCGRNARIFRRSSKSARPDVFAPVTTRSKGRLLVAARAETLSGIRCISHPGKARASSCESSGSGPIASAVLVWISDGYRCMFTASRIASCVNTGSFSSPISVMVPLRFRRGQMGTSRACKPLGANAGYSYAGP